MLLSNRLGRPQMEMMRLQMNRAIFLVLRILFVSIRVYAHVSSTVTRSILRTQTRNNILHKLAASSGGANASILRTSATVILYSSSL